MHNLVRTHDKTKEISINLHTGLCFVHMPNFSLFISIANILSEELWVDCVHNLLIVVP